MKLERCQVFIRVAQAINVAAHYRGLIYVKRAKEPGTSLPWGLTPLYSIDGKLWWEGLKGAYRNVNQ